MKTKNVQDPLGSCIGIAILADADLFVFLAYLCRRGHVHIYSEALKLRHAGVASIQCVQVNLSWHGVSEPQLQDALTQSGLSLLPFDILVASFVFCNAHTAI